MKKQQDGFWPLLVLIVLFVVTFTLIFPYFEMRTFNKFSEQKATYLDALFSELRVINNGGLK